MVYFFFRVLFIPFVYISWLIFELAIKKKKWAAIKGDALIGGCFVITALLIFLYLSR